MNFIFVSTLLASSQTTPQKLGGFTLPISRFFIDPNTGSGALIATFNVAVSRIITFLTVGGSLFFLFNIFVSAAIWVNAGSNESSVTGAKQRLLYSIIGLAVIVASYAVSILVGSLIGIDIFNPLTIFL